MFHFFSSTRWTFLLFSVGHLVRHSNIFCRTFIKSFRLSDKSDELRQPCWYLFQVRENKTEFYMKQSELLESQVYLDEVSDVLCIAQAELPALLPITEVAEILLHVPNGGWLLSRLVANSPDCFMEGIYIVACMYEACCFAPGMKGLLAASSIWIHPSVRLSVYMYVFLSSLHIKFDI